MDVSSPWTRKRVAHDIAYAAFIVLGLMALSIASSLYQFSQGRPEGEDSYYAFLIISAIIFGIPFLIAVLLGPCLSIFLWHDYRVAILVAASIAEFAGWVYAPYDFWVWILFPYGALSLGFGLLWFARERRSFGVAEP
jgi:hypothetical protein